MPRAIYTNRAKLDLRRIWLHVSRDSANRANALVRRLAKTCSLIAKTPGIGQARDDLVKRLRCFSRGSYVVFFRRIDDGIEVTRILHGSQDATAQFRSGDALSGD